MRLTLSYLLLVVPLTIACGDDGHHHDADAGDTPDSGDQPVAHTLFVATGAGTITSFDLATGDERPGTVIDTTGATDMTALDHGVIVANLSGRNEVLFFDARTMLEEARIASSGATGLRPVHGYLTPLRNGKQYWVVLNDGDGTAESNSAVFVDVVPGSATYLERVAEVRLGIGHHKATISSTAERIVISNISECDEVLQVFDYSNIASVQKIAFVSADELGFANCDPVTRTVPSPHGCATTGGKAFCSLTGPGQIVSVDLDAATPTFTVLDAAGAGAGYTARADDRYAYSLQTTPREGNGGADCQIGQLLTIDGQANAIVNQLALSYEGTSTCATPLAGTDEEGAGPGHILVRGPRMFITLAGRFGNADDRVRRELVIDISTRGAPVQQASVTVGAGTGHVNDALSGDGKWVFVANGVDGTVSQIDADELTVTRTITIAAPTQVTTFGTAEGPAHQTGPNH